MVGEGVWCGRRERGVAHKEWQWLETNGENDKEKEVFVLFVANFPLPSPPSPPRAIPRTEEGVGASGSTQNTTISLPPPFTQHTKHTHRHTHSHTYTHTRARAHTHIARRKGLFSSCFVFSQDTSSLVPQPAPNQKPHPSPPHHLIHHVNLTSGLCLNTIAPHPPLHSPTPTRPHAKGRFTLSRVRSLNMGKKDRKKKQQAAKSAARQGSGCSGGSGQPRLP